MVALLGSASERESSAAAAALWAIRSQSDDGGRWVIAGELDVVPDSAQFVDWVWDPEEWQVFYRSQLPAGRQIPPDFEQRWLRLLVTVRLRAALRSQDPVVRSLALALRLTSGDGRVPSSISGPTPPGALVISTMVHGTWGWRGDWWRPKGGFHKYIAINHRKNLYNRGARFGWSGAYDQLHRNIAAEDFVDWAAEVAPNGMQSVFAHSYGGEVAAMAATAGATTQELVLLSVPGTKHVSDAATSVTRMIDVRVPLDLVLLIARLPQRLAPASNLTEVVLPWNLLGHSTSHDENTWIAENVAARASL